MKGIKKMHRKAYFQNLPIEDFANFDLLCRKHFRNSFINSTNEYIVWPKHNIYFILSDVQSLTDLKCKILNWCSRSCIKGIPERDQKRMRNFVNEFLQTDFDYDDFETIYIVLGNAIKKDLTKKFVESGYDLGLLKI